MSNEVDEIMNLIERYAETHYDSATDVQTLGGVSDSTQKEYLDLRHQLRQEIEILVKKSIVPEDESVS